MTDSIKKQVWLWVKDLVEVAVTLGVIIVVLRLLLGSHTLVPLVVVTSGSMMHTSSDWHDWLLDGGMSEERIDGFGFQKGFNMGDMIVTISPDKYHIFHDTRLGDVVIYERDNVYLHSTGSTDPIIHRVVGVAHVEDWGIGKIDGTLDCYDAEKLQPYVEEIKKCGDSSYKCKYPKVPATGNFSLYITKGDNNMGADQCGLMGGIALPVNDAQLKARGWMRLPYVGWIKIIFNLILRILFFWL